MKWSKGILPTFCLLFLTLVVIDCSDSRGRGAPYGGEGDSDADSDSDGDSDGDGDGEGDGDGQYGDDVCETFSIEIEKKLPRLMILQDRSSSMTNPPNERDDGPAKWDISINAVDQMVSQFDEDIEFGIDFFSEEGDCSVSDEAASDTEPENGPHILDLMVEYGTDTTTPLAEASIYSSSVSSKSNPLINITSADSTALRVAGVGSNP